MCLLANCEPALRYEVFSAVVHNRYRKCVIITMCLLFITTIEYQIHGEQGLKINAKYLLNSLLVC